MSSFSGKLKEFPHISVDRFDGRNLASTAYFLSHAHSDHMVGLSSPQFLDHLESNSGVFLYCSVITARFLHASIRHRPLSPFLRPLPPDEPVKITIPTVANEPHHALTVTLIPAGHCPGSVMLLLEGRGGTVLYTGDFRLGVGESNQLRALHNPDGSVKTLHSLHIDTTFCHRRVLSFPSRQESAEAVGDLVEEWLARGNNHLIHLHCPAKYGYEFVYRSLHERFNMRVHVSRWKYRMYDTVPEIQDSLTTDATETWIHACDWRQSDEGSSPNSGGSGPGEGGAPRKRMLPCRCVPYGVDTEPNIRVIKPSALFYTTYQTHKEICQVSEEGTFCRVLLSMHASCSEVLDMVAYLRPRKVYPNVIPANSSKEEVLSLLHEALSQSGDHYSIEYDGRGCGGGGAGHFRRLAPPLSTSIMSAPDEEGDTDTPLGTFKRQLPPPSHGSPSKRRRHSDSGSIMQDVLLLTLPNPRGNMKGSLSLEGEPQQALSSATNYPETVGINATGTAADLRQVGLHSSPSLSSSLSSPMSAPVSPLLPPKISPAEMLCSAADDLSNDSALGHTLSAMPKSAEWGSRCGGGSSSQDSECSSMFSDDPDQTDLSKPADTDHSTTTREQNGGDGAPMRRTLTRDLSVTSVMSESGESVCSLLDDKAGRRRRMWYKHHHFSTPVTEELNNFTHPSRLTLRSSSLPDPHTLPLTHPPQLLSSHSLHPPPIPSLSPPLPLITVSSPSASESQLSSDDTSATVIMGGEFPDQGARPRDFETAFREKRSSTTSCQLNGWHRSDSAACKEPHPAHDVVIATANGADAVGGSGEDDDNVFDEVRDYTQKTLSKPAEVDNVGSNNNNCILDVRDDDSGISSIHNTFSDDRWCDTGKPGREKSITTSRPTVIRTAVAATLSNSCRGYLADSASNKGDETNHVPHKVQTASVDNSACSLKAGLIDVPSKHTLEEEQSRHSVDGSVSPLGDRQFLSREGTAVSVPRSSCLKTARRTAADLLEVVSLDQQQL